MNHSVTRPIRHLRTLRVVGLAAIAAFGRPVEAAAVTAAVQVPCPFADRAWYQQADIDCYRVTVPENRSIANGKTIDLMAAVLHGRGENLAADPIVFLDGGPGGNSFRPSLLNFFRDHALRQDRDIVLFTQRGTAHTSVEFCPGILRSLNELPAYNHTVEEDVQEFHNILRQCKSDLDARHIDLDAYNSAENARDVAAIVRALGYTEWNLFGISYGTRLALTAVRDVSDGVRSVILDSVYPPHAGGLTHELAFNLSFGMERLFTACEVSADCRKAFPSFREDFSTLHARLRQEPAIIELADPSMGDGGRYHLNHQDLVSLWLSFAYIGSLTPFAPLVLTEALKGNVQPLAFLTAGIAPGPGDEPDDVSYGMHYAFTCVDDAPYPRTHGVLPDHDILVVFEDFVSQYHYQTACEIWGAPELTSPIEAEPVVSDIPTLVLNGALDPATPLYYAQEVAETLTNSHLFLFPDQGHSISLRLPDCASSLIAAFLKDPNVRPDAECAAPGREISFVTDMYFTSGTGNLINLVSAPGAHAGSIVALAGVFLVSLSGLIVWPVAWASRKLRGHPLRVADGQSRYRAWAWAGTAILLVFIGGFTLAAADGGLNMLLFGLPAWSRFVFALPLLAALAGVMCAARLLRHWRTSGVTLPARIYYGVLSVGFPGVLIALATLGFY